jgi:hypothetical protein
MRTTWVISKREFAAYFGSPLAYTITSFFLLCLGLFFFFGVFYQDIGWPFYLRKVASLDNMFNASQLLFLLLIPALTMRLFAEERRSGTLELLTTLPVRDIEVVLGKYFAAVGYLLFVLALTLVYPIYVSTLGNLDWGAVGAGYLGLILVGLGYLAIGIFASSTRSSPSSWRSAWRCPSSSCTRSASCSARASATCSTSSPSGRISTASPAACSIPGTSSTSSASRRSSSSSRTGCSPVGGGGRP